mgnify:FL=1
MEKIPTYKSRFNPMLPTRALKTFIVPVEWWAFKNDRLDGRGNATLTKANVETRGQDAAEARKLVVREWGSIATVGTPTEVK